MITAAQCAAKFGDPILHESRFMRLYDIGASNHWALLILPRKIYMNTMMFPMFIQALENVKQADLCKCVKTWDGCFNVRKKRGGSSLSLHSWGMAFDINAAWNRFGMKPTMSKEFVDCFKAAGFDWGGDWKKPDGMHFQPAKFV